MPPRLSRNSQRTASDTSEVGGAQADSVSANIAADGSANVAADGAAASVAHNATGDDLPNKSTVGKESVRNLQL